MTRAHGLRCFQPHNIFFVFNTLITIVIIGRVRFQGTVPETSKGAGTSDGDVEVATARPISRILPVNAQQDVPTISAFVPTIPLDICTHIGLMYPQTYPHDEHNVEATVE